MTATAFSYPMTHGRRRRGQHSMGAGSGASQSRPVAHAERAGRDPPLWREGAGLRGGRLALGSQLCRRRPTMGVRKYTAHRLAVRPYPVTPPAATAPPPVRRRPAPSHHPTDRPTDRPAAPPDARWCQTAVMHRMARDGPLHHTLRARLRKWYDQLSRSNHLQEYF